MTTFVVDGLKGQPRMTFLGCTGTTDMSCGARNARRALRRRPTTSVSALRVPVPIGARAPTEEFPTEAAPPKHLFCRSHRRRHSERMMGRKPSPTSSSGKDSLKSVSRTDASNRLKKDASAPTPTLRFVPALAHACVISAVDVAIVKSAEASRFTNTVEETMPPKADSPMSN